jgi:hypothetical protein
MNCRQFRKQHVAFVDDTVSGLERAQMHDHLLRCAWCARHDARVRRSLLLVRNLPPIQPSADFRERLHSRVITAALMPERAIVRRWTNTGIAVAAAVLISVGIAARSAANAESSVTLSLPPVVASVPEPRPSIVESPVLAMPAVMASFSTGIALWPAAIVADEAAEYFANAAFMQTSLTR